MFSFSYFGIYFNKIQCNQTLQGLVSGFATVADYTEFALTTFGEQIQMTGEPYGAAAATAVLTIEKGVLELAAGGGMPEPSMVGMLEHMITSPLTSEEKALIQNYDRISASKLKYIPNDENWGSDSAD